MTPPYRYLYRFTTTPLANQALVEEMRLVRFVEVCGPVHPHLLLKGFPGPGAARPLAPRAARDRALATSAGARLDAPRTPGGGSAHRDTPFIEATTIGVPTIGLWDPGLWEMRADAAPHFDLP